MQQLIESRDLVQAVGVFDDRVRQLVFEAVGEKQPRAREVAIAEPQCLRADQQGASHRAAHDDRCARDLIPARCCRGGRRRGHRFADGILQRTAGRIRIASEEAATNCQGEHVQLLVDDFDGHTEQAVRVEEPLPHSDSARRREASTGTGTLVQMPRAAWKIGWRARLRRGDYPRLQSRGHSLGLGANMCNRTIYQAQA